MKILHTSDWHIGRRLGRHDRMTEHRDVLDETIAIADEHEVDLVVVSGDVFDRPVPPMDALALGLGALVRLAKDRPVVAVAGNHDSPELFEVLAPLMRPQRVHLVGDVKRPDEGALLGPEELGVPAVAACFPFLREGRVVDFMREAGEWYGQYAGRVALITARYNEALVERAGTDLVPLLVAHFMVSGVRVSHSERELHIGEAYAATPQSIPAGPQYVAMGHIHAPQPVPHSPVPAQYAGSLLPLDFGEAGESKRVVIVDAEPGRLAVATSVPIAGGRPLVRVTDTWDAIEARADGLESSYLDLMVRTRGPDEGLAQRAHDRFPFLVKVRASRTGAERAERIERENRGWDELYEQYYRREFDEAPPDDLLAMLREVLEEAADATA